MMTIDEKARLAFHFLASGHPERANELQESIATKQYVLLDLDFTSAISSSILFAHCWSIEYWKNVAEHSIGNAKYFYDVLQGKPVPTEAELKVRLNEFEGKSLAIDAALVEICHMFDLCPDDVRRFSKAEPYQLISDSAQVDEAYLAELVAAFDAMLKSWPMNAIQKSEVGLRIH